MKNLLALVALSVICAALIPATTLADNGPITGSFTVSYTAGDPGHPTGCDPSNSVYVEARGIGNSTGSLGTAILTIAKCWNYVDGTYAGSFTLSSPDGRDAVTGTYAGSDDACAGCFPGAFFPFHGVLTATAGTGKFRGAKGSMKFTAIAVGIGPSSGIAYYAIEGNPHN
jgi:hypothetical protein